MKVDKKSFLRNHYRLIPWNINYVIIIAFTKIVFCIKVYFHVIRYLMFLIFSGLTFGKSKKNFDEIDRTGFGRFVKKNFDEIDRTGFGRFVSKKNFDEIDRTGFGRFVKRNFDEIDRTGFGRFVKRPSKKNFDEIDNVGFRSFY